MQKMLGAGLVVLLMSTQAFARDDESALFDGDGDTPWSERHAFERNFALAVYGIGWAGEYNGAGVGGRARYEFRQKVGLDVYTDHLMIEAPGGRRHDHPVGFNLYVPFRLSENWRVRPLFGFCAVFSYYNPDQDGVDNANDIHFGVHAGGGLEYAFGRYVSMFLDVQGTLYFGHDRYDGGWGTHIEDGLSAWGLAEAKLGVQVHL